MSKASGKSILFELLRSYISLAETLNLSVTVRKLGSTRQTVRRHINILEEARGEKLFELKDRQYHLTEVGLRSLIDAQTILAHGEDWLEGTSLGEPVLTRHKNKNEQGHCYYLQQHRLSRLWIDGSSLLRHAHLCWAKAMSYIESEELKSVRPYWVVYRREGDRWLCSEIGENSSCATW